MPLITKTDLNNYLKAHLRTCGAPKQSKFKIPRPQITCENGTTLSVQAGKYLYCNPKEDYPSGGYYSVEVGSYRQPDKVLEENLKSPDAKYIYRQLEQYNDGKDNGGVWAYVPISLVVDIINANGGADLEFVLADPDQRQKDSHDTINELFGKLLEHEAESDKSFSVKIKIREYES